MLAANSVYFIGFILLVFLLLYLYVFGQSKEKSSEESISEREPSSSRRGIKKRWIVLSLGLLLVIILFCRILFDKSITEEHKIPQAFQKVSEIFTKHDEQINDVNRYIELVKSQTDSLSGMSKGELIDSLFKVRAELKKERDDAADLKDRLSNILSSNDPILASRWLTDAVTLIRKDDSLTKNQVYSNQLLSIIKTSVQVKEVKVQDPSLLALIDKLNGQIRGKDAVIKDQTQAIAKLDSYTLALDNQRRNYKDSALIAVNERTKAISDKNNAADLTNKELSNIDNIKVEHLEATSPCAEAKNGKLKPIRITCARISGIKLKIKVSSINHSSDPKLIVVPQRGRVFLLLKTPDSDHWGGPISVDYILGQEMEFPIKEYITVKGKYQCAVRRVLDKENTILSSTEFSLF